MDWIAREHGINSVVSCRRGTPPPHGPRIHLPRRLAAPCMRAHRLLPGGVRLRLRCSAGPVRRGAEHAFAFRDDEPGRPGGRDEPAEPDAHLFPGVPGPVRPPPGPSALPGHGGAEDRAAGEHGGADRDQRDDSRPQPLRSPGQRVRSSRGDDRRGLLQPPHRTGRKGRTLVRGGDRSGRRPRDPAAAYGSAPGADVDHRQGQALRLPGEDVPGRPLVHAGDRRGGAVLRRAVQRAGSSERHVRLVLSFRRRLEPALPL